MMLIIRLHRIIYRFQVNNNIFVDFYISVNYIYICVCVCARARWGSPRALMANVLDFGL